MCYDYINCYPIYNMQNLCIMIMLTVTLVIRYKTKNEIHLLIAHAFGGDPTVFVLKC